MTAQVAAPDAEAVRLMRAGRLADALMFAERAVAGKTVCSPSHALLATILLRSELRVQTPSANHDRAQLEPLIAVLRQAGVPLIELD